MHIGDVFFHAGDSPPGGAVLANGQSLSATSYPLLFQVIGYTYGGSGDNFNVPDLVNKMPVGSGGDYVLNDTGGAKSVVLTVAQLARHRHVLFNLGFALVDPVGATPAYTPVGSAAYSAYEGSNQAHENMPPYVGLLPCIQAE